MRVRGRVFRDGSWWLAEIPALDALTQGRSRRQALAMAGDWVASMLGADAGGVAVHAGRGEVFEVSVDSEAALTGLLLRRRREAAGLTLRQVAARLGSSSPNAYARYEQGRTVPTVDKLGELLRAVAPERDLVLCEAAVD